MPKNKRFFYILQQYFRQISTSTTDSEFLHLQCLNESLLQINPRKNSIQLILVTFDDIGEGGFSGTH